MKSRTPFLALLLAVPLACRSAPPSAPDRSAQGGQGFTLDAGAELARKLRAPTGLNLGWVDGDTYLCAVDDGQEGKRLDAVEVVSGDSAPFVDAARMRDALAALPGWTKEEAEKASRETSFEFDAQKDAVLIQAKSDLFVWRRSDATAVRLTGDAEEEEGASFSPDGKRVAFVRGHNLHVVAATGGDARALTTDGSETNIVGRLDWVYQEEVYGRGHFEGYWWSPDSRRIAFLVLDESKVPAVLINDHRKPHQDVETWHYPKAGDPNPTATLHVLDVDTGERREVDLSGYPPDDRLIVRVAWSPDSMEIACQVQNRIQTFNDLLSADPASGKTHRILRDATKVWIEPVDCPIWIDGGARFLWLSERDGWKHLYLYTREGELVRRLTEGEWEVDDLLACDEQRGVVYFVCDKDDVKGGQLFRVGLDGANLERVSRGGGTHAISMAPGCEFYVDTHSAVFDPGAVDLCANSGALVRSLWKADVGLLAAAGLAAPEFVQVPTRDGFLMEAMLIKPPGFDPSRRWPVMSNTYSGPHSPSVRDAFSGANQMYLQVLAQQGYVVWVCDNRSASGKGLVSEYGIYENLGSQELADLEDGIDWLVAQGWADPERVGIYGWSYGGYMSAFALTHSAKFKIGIAGAPVTDWHFYDSIYTERYMNVPAANEKGYDSSSVVDAAANLNGRMLVIHGTIDENVHLQNTLQLVLALQKAGRMDFEMMLYPGNRHGVVDPAQRKHLNALMLDFVIRNL